MLKVYEHYDVEVVCQEIEGKCFKEVLQEAGIKYVDLPIGMEVIRYQKDGVTKYACTRDIDGGQRVYITEQVPDDLNFAKMMSDIDHQERGYEPDVIETKLHWLVREATRIIAEEKGDKNPWYPEEINPKDIAKAILACFGYSKDDLKEMDRTGFDEEYFAEMTK